MKKFLALMMFVAMIGAFSFGSTGCDSKPAAKKDATTTKDKDAAPKDKDAAPKDKDAAPKDKDAATKDKDAAPKDKDKK